jgi:hypothetical protein
MGTSPYQPALFSLGRATPDLFEKSVLRQHVDAFHVGRLGDPATIAAAIRNWTAVLGESRAAGGQRRARQLNESNLEQSFNASILCGVFGFDLPGSGSGAYSLLPKIASASGVPDAVFGLYDSATSTTIGTVELKPPRTNLDAPQSRETKETPVEQAFRAARTIQTVRWIVVSNLDEIRLYHVSQPNRFFVTRLSDAVSPRGLTPGFTTALSVFHRTQLVPGSPGLASNIDNLLERTDASNAAIRGGFYDLFTQARADLYRAILGQLGDVDSADTKRLALQKAQKLLDRVIFIRFCEDHPYELLPRERLRRVVQHAPEIPGRHTDKIYQACKGYFDEVRLGNVHGAAYTVFAYDGELFDDDSVLDHIDLDDALFAKVYRTRFGDRERKMLGPFGFWEYNFSVELNEHLLGHIYEKSLADLERGDLPTESTPRRQTSSALRARYGIWYTPQTLTDYLASEALSPILARLYSQHVTELPKDATREQQRMGYQAYYDAILSLRILDPSCGSGAFLVSCFDVLAAACQGARFAIEALSDSAQAVLFESLDYRLMHECLYGIDLNPEAVAITKLALWLKTAHKQETNVDLTDRIVAADSLDGLRRFRETEFDVVIGNPPWGAVWSAAQRSEYKHRFAFDREDFRSEEAFLRLARSYMRRGGVLAYVLPDTILYSEKRETRKILLEEFVIKAFHQLGPEWFLAINRMSTLVLVAEYVRPTKGEAFRSFTLVDKDRKAAIRGEYSLFQADAQYAGVISQDRCRTDGDDGYEIRLFQYEIDDVLMQKLTDNGVPLCRNVDRLGKLTERGRGIELNKEGLVIQCPACGRFSEPPEWNRKEGRYELKRCVACGHTFRFEEAASRIIVQDGLPNGPNEALYVDGDDIHRYQPLRYKTLHLGLAGINYKDAVLYRGPKALFRQAGVGNYVVYDPSDAYCPQSVYVYRVTDRWRELGYTNEFLVGVLSSRVLQYYRYKRFGEVDSARAHVKVTHERLADMPIPKLTTSEDRDLAFEIGERVVAMREAITADARYLIDREIEDRVASLFRLRPPERAYMNGQFGLVHENETIKVLFPYGPPTPVVLNEDPELL